MELIALSLATLAGGIAGSFGVNLVIRGRIGRRVLGGWRWWGVLLYAIVVLGVVAAGFTWMVRVVLAEASEAAAGVPGPGFFLAFGLLAGLPFTIPTTIVVWRELHRPRGKAARKKPATRQDRLAFAKDLETQLRDYVGTSRPVHLELQGDKGRILFFGGEFTRQEGERLVAALRADLQDNDFQRVEGQGDKGKWWVPV